MTADPCFKPGKAYHAMAEWLGPAYFAKPPPETGYTDLVVTHPGDGVGTRWCIPSEYELATYQLMRSYGMTVHLVGRG